MPCPCGTPFFCMRSFHSWTAWSTLFYISNSNYAMHFLYSQSVVVASYRLKGNWPWRPFMTPERYRIIFLHLDGSQTCSYMGFSCHTWKLCDCRVVLFKRGALSAAGPNQHKTILIISCKRVACSLFGCSCRQLAFKNIGLVSPFSRSLDSSAKAMVSVLPVVC